MTYRKHTDKTQGNWTYTDIQLKRQEIELPKTYSKNARKLNYRKHTDKTPGNWTCENIHLKQHEIEI